ncbi:phage tail assembly protein [Sphingopyxis sp. GW247-27LB]|uniref:phage tail assembly protein n=1 Tax=Sphingopyxis sp. GW247-27LB TaxID=2012632 RepID=UPI000BA7BFCA|nr:phage tail assembly protein [Sphingopyxis sp. GW247-27LB]PAL22653.1 hypothetical protein CD928_11370 [Sphingopyxis sp. GW247-27LB]
MNHYLLKHPIETRDGKPMVAEVHIRRAKGKDLRAIAEAKNDFDGTLMLIDRLCQHPDGGPIFPGFADELDAEDIEALGELVMAILPSGQKTGETA